MVTLCSPSMPYRAQFGNSRSVRAARRVADRTCVTAGAVVTVVTMAKDSDTPVVLSRIYTKTGDDGTTALGDFSRTAKTDLRLAAYADVDEANSAIGVAVTTGGAPHDLHPLVFRVPNELFHRRAHPLKPSLPT